MNPDVTHQGISDVPSCAQPPPNRPSSHDDAFFNLDSLFLDMPFEKDLPTDDELKETLKCLDSQPLDLFPPTEHYSDVQLEKFVEQQNSPSTYENGSERFWIEHSTQNLSDQSTWPHCGEKNVKMESNYVPCLFDPALVGAQGFVPRHLSRSSVLSSSKFRYDGSHKVLKANSNSLKKSFRGVSRHRLTQRWEASLWLNGKQLYLGGFNVQEDAARAYDLAALACKGAKASTNFRAAEYERQLRELHDHSEEEVVAYIRRRSTAFSRGRSKYRGVSGQSGRWEARIGSFKGRKNVSFGVFETEEEAARQYDRALVIEKGRSAKTNFPLQEYDKEALEYLHTKSLCDSYDQQKHLEESYTLPSGRTVSPEEVKRGIITIVDPNGRATVLESPDTLLSLKQGARSGLGLSKIVDLDRIGLTHKGNTIESDIDVYHLKDGDTVLCFVRPQKPPHTVTQCQSDDDDDQAFSLEKEVESLFVIRSGTIPGYARSFILNTIGIPEWIVAPMTHITPKQIIWFISWCSMSRICYNLDLGPLFILATIFYLIFSNLGTRTGDFSAYSIFNRGVRRLPGDRLDADHIRRTGFAAM